MGPLSGYVRAFLRKGIRTRQAILFVIGGALGCLFQLLTSSSADFFENEIKTIDQISVSTPSRITFAAPLVQAVSLKPPPAGSDITHLLGEARHSRPKTKSHILRFAKDEVRMFECLKPMVYYTSDALCSASASTWFQDYLKDGKGVDAFLPSHVIGTIRQRVKADITTLSGDVKQSHTEHVVNLLQYLCSNAKAKGAGSKLLRYKWFALAPDNSYISSRKMSEFLSYYEDPEPICFARQRESGHSTDLVWSSNPGFVLNQRAIATICPFLPQYVLSPSEDQEAKLSRLLAGSGVNCVSPDGGNGAVFVDVASVNGSFSALGHQSLGSISGLAHGVFFSVADDARMYLLRRSDKLDEIEMYNKKVEKAYSTLVNMQLLMRKYPLVLPGKQQAAAGNISIPKLGTIGAGLSDDDTVWMSSDSSYQLSANFDGPTGSQRSAAFSKDVESQLQVACKHLSSQKDPLICVNMFSGYVRFRPSLGMEYKYNLLVKSSVLDANQAEPQLQSVTMVRRLGQFKVSSFWKMDNSVPVHIVTVITSRTAIFQSFMAMYERMVLLKPMDVTLTVVRFAEVASRDVGGNSDRGVVDPIALITLYMRRYNKGKIKWVDVPGKTLSLASGVKKAVGDVTGDEVVLVIDPSLLFKRPFLPRCRLIASPGRQAYLPVALPGSRSGSSNSHCQVREAVCAYKSDLERSGWLSSGAVSMEDLVGKLKQYVHVVQAVEPDLSC